MYGQDLFASGNLAPDSRHSYSRGKEQYLNIQQYNTSKHHAFTGRGQVASKDLSESCLPSPSAPVA